MLRTAHLLVLTTVQLLYTVQDGLINSSDKLPSYPSDSYQSSDVTEHNGKNILIQMPKTNQ